MSSKKSAGSYPDNNPKTVVGLTKPSIFVIPPSALLHCGRAFMDGAAKYGRFNWRDKRVSASVYLDAIYRHQLAYIDGEDFSADTVAKGTPVHHLGHMMACAAIVLDAMETGNLIDDRPTAGAAADMIARWTMGKKPT